MPKSEYQYKKTVRVTLEPHLLTMAREAKLNLSAILTAALKQELRVITVERWKEQNKAGLQELNRITRELGLLSDDCRGF
ncbi:type II toxin-antitoxin system CcdA family antitoxin [Pluralibacter gergoviae]|uniref:type II toxin-antitoxin system CcdA family antitoxin n=1 Tax=Pluralibacter gergoviae TaxID=61647 RepID=UPI0029103352|nr:type II toxin-antitoxin system CcdA family antitoxin [Pluralibacter gergoviae]ELO7478347.1 type II toxin-antitoxin system CcdA family antitoxin [Pluralibacter gergoviae]ELW9441765.1 type II toxin-antitoxin system CcdA family antitoxin [Pluralibacter gergoviae]MDU4002787.1 type II toxin-antitoxin system CcdA family antitoxin [Pluralibacter gergoviae]